MIISHEHRFIFLKTRKTAGTSVEIALSRHCGPDDIITPLIEADERLRRECGGRGPQHYEATPKRDEIFNHMSAYRVRELVGRRTWRKYYKFTTERNPWDAVISLYFWRYRDKEPIPVSRFIQSRRIETLTRNAHIYRLRDKVAVDNVCLYESLESSLEEVRDRLALSSLELPRAKGGIRPDRHYREFYTAADEARVRALFAQTIETFGYEF